MRERRGSREWLLPLYEPHVGCVLGRGALTAPGGETVSMGDGCFDGALRRPTLGLRSGISEDVV